MTPEECKEIILDQLDRQQEFFRELCDISQEQKRLTLEDNAQQLPALTEDREKILRKLEVLDRVSENYRLYWQKTPEVFTEEENQKIHSKFLEVAHQLRDLLCADEALALSVQEKMAEIRSKIGTTKTGRRVIAAYTRPHPEFRPRYVSKLST